MCELFRRYGHLILPDKPLPRFVEKLTVVASGRDLPRHSHGSLSLFHRTSVVSSSHYVHRKNPSSSLLTRNRQSMAWRTGYGSYEPTRLAFGRVTMHINTTIFSFAISVYEGDQ